jgi:hypothetical protein
MYLLISDFSKGLDTRKSAITSPAGTLQACNNAHITRGGEIEKRMAFVPYATLPVGATFGLAGASGQLYVFGSNPMPSGMPPGVNYQQLLQPSASGSITVTGGTANAGVNYFTSVTVTDENSNVVNLFGSSGVVNWATSNENTASLIAAQINANTATTTYSATANGAVVTILAPAGSADAYNGFVITVNVAGNATAGAPFNLSGGSAANMNGILYCNNFSGQVYAIASFSDGSIYHYFNGSRVTDWDAISLQVSDINGVAASLAAKISISTGFNATASGNIITITASQVNTPFTIAASTVNGGVKSDQYVSVSIPPVQIATATLPQISTATLLGTFETGDVYTITLNGTNFVTSGSSAGTGTTATTFKSKVYCSTQSLLYFSDVLAPASFIGDVNGSGFINMTNQNSGSETLTGVADYQGNLAVFSRRTVQIWSMDADPTNNSQMQVLSNIGTYAPRSVVSVGSWDVFFLSDMGIRSLRVRDASNNALIYDAGTNIDTIIATDTASLTETVKSAAIGIIEPTDGRYWLVIGPKIYVYSYFPTPGIQAWSTYTPGFNISDMIVMNGQVYCRSGDTIYLYGGTNGATYDNSEVTVAMPFLDAGKPAHNKQLQAVDMACDGTWKIYAGMDQSAPNARDLIGSATGSTYGQGRIIAQGIGTHIGIQLINNTPGYARIGNFAVHFDINDDGE